MEHGFALVDNFPIKDIFKFRQQWPVGKLIAVYLGQDGKVRVATVITADGIVSYIQEEFKEGIFFLAGSGGVGGELVKIHFFFIILMSLTIYHICILPIS